MEQLFLSIFVGVLLLGMVLYWALSGSNEHGSKIKLPEAMNALNSLETQLLPLQIIERIFDPGDQEFINRQNAPQFTIYSFGNEGLLPYRGCSKRGSNSPF